MWCFPLILLNVHIDVWCRFHAKINQNFQTSIALLTGCFETFDVILCLVNHFRKWHRCIQMKRTKLSIFMDIWYYVYVELKDPKGPMCLHFWENNDFKLDLIYLRKIKVLQIIEWRECPSNPNIEWPSISFDSVTLVTKLGDLIWNPYWPILM